MSNLAKRIDTLEAQTQSTHRNTLDWRDEIRQGKRAQYVLACIPGWRRGLDAAKIAEIKAMTANEITEMEFAGATADEIITVIERACACN